MPRPLPLGEVASRSDDGEGEDANRSATASGYDPTCEKGVLKSPQAFQNPQIKNLFSADDAQSNAERILNRLARRPQRRRVAAVQLTGKVVLGNAHHRAGQRNYADEVR